MRLKVTLEVHDVNVNSLEASYVESRTAFVTCRDYVGDMSLSSILAEMKLYAQLGEEANSIAKNAEKIAQKALDRAESGVKDFTLGLIEEDELNALKVTEMQEGILYLGMMEIDGEDIPVPEPEPKPSASYDDTTGILTIPDATYDDTTGYLTLQSAHFNQESLTIQI